MRHLYSDIHPLALNASGAPQRRRAARGIALQGEDVLLIFTQRYRDYSLPGGGVDEGESIEQALLREMSEETGAQNIRNIRPFGCYEEHRPWIKGSTDILHMHSYFYLCDVDPVLGQNQLMPQEVANGVRPLWVNLHSAIEHNRSLLDNDSSDGLALKRELFVLERVREECLS